MESITEYIAKKLKLKVNRTKSKVSRPRASTLLGLSFYSSNEGWQIRIAPKSFDRIRKKMKEKTKRNDPVAANEKIMKMEAVICGWVNYFAIAKGKKMIQELDELVRTRLRIGIWKQRKKPKTKRINLIKLGLPKQQAYEWSYCRIAHSPILCRALSNAYFTRLKYIGFTNYYYWKTEHQLKLF